MPVDRGLAADLADTLVDLYSSAETRLAAEVARRLGQGTGEPDWADQKLVALGGLRLWVERFLARLDSDAAPVIEETLARAHQRGGGAAVRELRRLGSGVAGQETVIRSAIPNVDALQTLAFLLASTLRGTHFQVLRWALDAYREVVAKASADALLGVSTRRRAAQVAWERLLAQGVTGFVDKAGRRWELTSYVEMATHSTVVQAAVQAHLDTLGAAGITLVIVSDAPQECVKCRPWEGKVLTRFGPGGPWGPGRRVFEVEHATQDRTVRVEVAGSVAEAVSRGLMHPNCRHSLSAYLPGVTTVPTHTVDAAGDKARQRLRGLERKVRRWKRVEAAAIDPEAARVARARVRSYQGLIREHIAESGLHRQPAREQIGVAR